MIGLTGFDIFATIIMILMTLGFIEMVRSSMDCGDGTCDK